jgi:hypothetical protein
MPRDGSGNYTQPFPNVVDGTILDTAVYNGFTHDVETDLNAPRPVVAGGTGANNATSARANIYAAPLDALAYNGMQVNGSMEVSQQLALGGTATGGYIVDGWSYLGPAGAGAFGSFAINDIPGFPNTLYVAYTVGKPSLAANDISFIYQSIEGYRLSRLAWGTAAAQPITLAFWSKHTVPGIYSVAVRNSAANRAYVTSYTQAASGVSQYNTITISGDTTGVWTKDNTIGMYLSFAFASGSSQFASNPDMWIASGAVALSTQVNGASSSSNFNTITGVVVLPGTEAPSVARSPLIMRPYDQELVTCQRYWQYLPSGGPILFSSTTTALTGVSLPVQMRATPTVTAPAIFNAFTSNVGYVNLTSLSSSNMNTQDGMVTFNCSTTTATGVGFLYPPTTTRMIKLDARL